MTAQGTLSRRGFLAASAAAGLAGLSSRAFASEGASGRSILKGMGLGGVSGFALADVQTGLVLDAFAPHRVLPPASVAKVVTALFALDRLGPSFQFETRFLATGPVDGGVLRGDLILEGGGDPTFDTDALGSMIGALAAGGVRKVEGRFLVAHGALPSLARIEPDQPEQAAYNPAITGASLNFNRVHLTWKPGAKGPKFGFAAPGIRHAADVPGFSAEVAGSVPRHRWQDETEVWSFPAHSVGGRGGVWLPVRAPAGYAGNTARALARQAGIEVPEPELVTVAPPARGLTHHASTPLEPMMRGMLRYSTNLTAEAAGLRAATVAGRPPDDLGASGAMMGEWAERTYGARGYSVFANHSGLSTRSQISAANLVRMLAAEKPRMSQLMREHPFRDNRGSAPKGVSVVAKTGTMYFVSALAGYLQGSGGRSLAFAILSADLGAREQISNTSFARPPGARSWATAARSQQAALLRLWAGRLADADSMRPRPRPPVPKTVSRATSAAL